jgi:hypothetical protein
MAFPTAGSLKSVLDIEEAILELGGENFSRKILDTEIHPHVVP